ncbi:MAG: hypothetical protein IJ719_22070 [Clostridia bacterium]|nr:hypothetical protein [Clostridia bacterium]
MKKLGIFVLALVMLFAFSANAWAANTKADNNAKKGLIVDEAGLYRYSTRYQSFGPKVEPYYASLSDITDSTYDGIYSRLRLINRQDYSIGVRVSCEVYYNGRYDNTYSWEYTDLPAKIGSCDFWLEEFNRADLSNGSLKSGNYLYSWYIDGKWLIDREFNISR